MKFNEATRTLNVTIELSLRISPLIRFLGSKESGVGGGPCGSGVRA